MSVSQTTQSNYGQLGIDVGSVGRWLRLGFGLLILLPLVIDIIAGFDSSTETMAFYVRSAGYFLAIVIVYVAVYWLLGERFFAHANPWINTLILVGPAFFVAWWDLLVLPWAGVDLPTELSLAAGLYIGLSFILQWGIKYGGCEVVSLPILLLGRRYQTYCIPIVAVDAVEKAVVDRNKKRSERAA